jgi:hypothetical protein
MITERTNQNFNFQNFTLTEKNVKTEQPNSRAAVQLGIPGEKLDFSQDVTLTMYVGNAFNDLELDVLYKEDGDTVWNPHTTCTITNGNCTFTTNHATIYTVNGVHSETGQAPMEINVEVQDTLSLDCYDTSNTSGDHTVTLSNTTTGTGYVVAGTPSVGQSTCSATTNDDQGYYLTIENSSTNGTGNVLEHEDPNIPGTWYSITDLTQWDDTTLTTESWSAPTTKGLGFAIISFPDTNTSNNYFDGVWNETSQCPEGTNPDTNTYAGIPDTPQTIAAVPEYNANTTTTTICYKVDVPASQQSGQYAGQVTFTAVTDASTYLN